MRQGHGNLTVITQTFTNMRTQTCTTWNLRNTNFSSSFLNCFFYNTRTLICEVTRPVNEHQSFCNNWRVYKSRMLQQLNSEWLCHKFLDPDIECPLSPCCQLQFCDSSYIFRISVHLCYPISFLLLLGSMLLSNLNTSSTDHIITSSSKTMYITTPKCSASTIQYNNINHIQCHISFLPVFL